MAVALLCVPTQSVAEQPLESLVQRHLGVFLARADRREQHERVTLVEDTLEVWFLRTLRRGKRDSALCEAARWLVGGRLERTLGASALFAERRDIRAITLVFYEVETSVTPDAEGRYLQTRTAAPRARLTLSRESAAAIDPRIALQSLQGEKCVRVGESMMDGFWAP
jgi:hypothetical protein